MSEITIRYTRPPDRVTVFRQQLVECTEACIITLNARTGLSSPVRARGGTVLEPDAPVVWFTFPDAWHDIGRFHLRDGTFTGFYANVLTPVEFLSRTEWATTDLCLDVWLDAEGAVLLDEDELEAALRAGAVTAEQAAAARAEASRLLAAAAAGEWPPPVCREWTLERARAATGTRGAGPV